eukprot:1394166-Heterocapsa_arctica.AAC.1
MKPDMISVTRDMNRSAAAMTEHLTHNGGDNRHTKIHHRCHGRFNTHHHFDNEQNFSNSMGQYIHSLMSLSKTSDDYGGFIQADRDRHEKNHHLLTPDISDNDFHTSTEN